MNRWMDKWMEGWMIKEGIDQLIRWKDGWMDVFMTQTTVFLQPNMLVYPTPVRTEALVMKSPPDLNASVHQAGRDPLVLKVRKSSVHLPL